MSLDLWLVKNPCELCKRGERSENFNYTYNVAPMWYKIWPEDNGMVEIEGMTGKEARQKLIYTREQLELAPKDFELLSPPNGWGTYEGFLEFINKLIYICTIYPNSIWEASR